MSPTRLARLALVVVASAVVSLAPPGLAGVTDNPVGGTVALAPVRTAHGLLEGEVLGRNGGSAYLALSREVIRGNRRVVTTEGTYGEQVPSYVFDGLHWTASAQGVVATKVSVERYVRHRAGWKLLSVTERAASALVDLRWTGSSAPTTNVSPSVLCAGLYVTACVPYVDASRSAAAVVSGSVAFGGLGVTARLPARHPGSMSHGIAPIRS